MNLLGIFAGSPKSAGQDPRHQGASGEGARQRTRAEKATAKTERAGFRSTQV